MSHLANDSFTGSDGAALSSTWTLGRNATAGGSCLIAGNAFRTTLGSSGDLRVSRRVNITAPVNGVVGFRFQWPDGDSCFPRWYFRSTNTALDTQGGYRIELNRNLGTYSLGYNDGAYGGAQFGSAISKTFTAGVWYRVRFGVVGDELKARVWDDGDPEPAGWDIEVTDSLFATGGSGCGLTVGAGSAGAEFDIDDFTLDTTWPVTGLDFPSDVLAVRTELDIGGVWADITPYVYQRDQVVITRGRADEAAEVNPTTANLTLNNRDGRFSPRNPTAAYYGLIGRNTPLRIGIRQAEGWMQITQPTGTTLTPTHASTTDKAALDITGDLDLRIELDLDSWRDRMELITKWTETGNQRSFRWYLSQTGHMFFTHSPDGTTEITASTTVPIPILSGRLAVRVTLDVNDGSGNRVRRFYYSDAIDGTWTQLGAATTTAGVTSIFASTALLYVLDNPNSTISGSTVRGRVYHAQVLSGISGTAVANPDFTAQTEGDTTFSDTVSNIWTLTGGVELTNHDIRFHGEMTAWPQVSDPSGTDVHSPVTASGVLRRLAQGKVIGSAMYRGTLRDPNIIAYWAMEDGSDSTVLASAYPLGRPILVTPTTVLASDSGFVASDPLPLVGETPLQATVRNYTASGFIGIQFMMHIPAGGLSTGSIICTVKTSGTAARWDLLYGTGGSGTLTLRLWDRNDTVVTTFATAAFNVDDAYDLIKLRFTNDGADVDSIISEYTQGSATPVSYPNTVAGYQIGRVTSITFNPSSVADYNQVAIGHLAITTSSATLWAEVDQMNAYAGESATDRIARLCEEEGVTFSPFGPRGDGDSVLMGPQTSNPLLTLLREAAEADLGILYEGREFLELRYRPRRAIAGQVSKLTLGYTAHEMSTLEPVEDDQLTRNDVTAQRINGGSARAELTSGPLSTDIPPVGVGRYDITYPISVEDDSTLEDQAGFRLRLGTVDEARYPRLDLKLQSTHFADLRELVARMDLGDRMTITDPPPWLAQEDIVQLMQGYTERLTAFQREFSLNLSPANPWTTGTYDDPYDRPRYGSGDSTTAEALDTTETGVDVVAGTAKARWTTTASSWPFNVMLGGELMTVTAVSGSGLSQTLTVTRSVNGVIKTHLTGQPVTLIPLTYYAL